MKKFIEEKHDLLAGIVAIIAFIAIIFEMALGQFSTESIAGGIKDAAGIFIDFLVLLVAAGALIKKKVSNITQLLENAIDQWGSDNIPFLFKVEGFEKAQNSNYTQGFALLQNPKNYIGLLKKNLTPNHPEWQKYAAYGSKATGKFIDMPSFQTMTSGKFDICVIMTQSHFKGIENFETIFSDIIDQVNRNTSDSVKAYSLGKELKFRIEFANEIKTKEEINELIRILDYIVSLVKVIA